MDEPPTDPDFDITNPVDENFFLTGQLELLSEITEDSRYYKIFITVTLYNYLSLFETLYIMERYLGYEEDIPKWWKEMNRYPEEVLWMDLLHLDGEKRIPSSKFVEVLVKKLRIIHSILESPEKNFSERTLHSKFDKTFIDLNTIIQLYLDEYQVQSL